VIDLRITKRTNLAIRLLMYCAENSDRLVTKAETANCYNVSGNHLAQVVNQLSQIGFLTTRRGRSGGMKLAKGAHEIPVGEVFRHVEGGVPLTECFADADNSCNISSSCRLKPALADAAEAFYASLDKITLESLICDNFDLAYLLQPVQCVR
jgi:Rrf2 family nitric oxide-sensitive transcriptional repressor